jgi:hypothetical protein
MSHKGDKRRLQLSAQTEAIIIVSDGSYLDPAATGAWIITTASDYPQNYLQGHAQSPGPSFTQDSHRAELTGILGAIVHLDAWITEENLHDINFLIAADNKSALYYACDKERYPFITADIPDFDLIMEIRRLLLHRNFSFQHVKGHQDTPGAKLTLLESINVHVDRLAKSGRITGRPINIEILPNESHSVWANGHKVCKDVAMSIRHSIDNAANQLYLDSKLQMDSTVYARISWMAMAKAMATIGAGRRRWVSKLSSGNLGTNAVLHKWGQKDTPNCRRCNKPENVKHTLQCQHASTASVWKATLEDLKTWLQEHHTDPSLIRVLIDNLTTWASSNNHHQPRTELEKLQDSIGWEQLLYGRFDKSWQEIQDLYFKSLGKRNTGVRWLASIIAKMWDICWDLWQTRNHHEHEHDMTILHEKVSQEVHIMLQKDQAIFKGSKYLHLVSDNTKERLTTASTAYKTQWMKSVTAAQAFLSKKNLDTNASTRMQENFRSYFTPAEHG